MSIRKISSSLYTTLVVRMVLSFLISVLIFGTLVVLSGVIVDVNEKNHSYTERNYQLLLTDYNRSADEIQRRIDEEGISINEAVMGDWGETDIDSIGIGIEDREDFLLNLTEGAEDSIIIEGLTEYGLKYYYYNGAAVYEISDMNDNAYVLYHRDQGDNLYVLLNIVSALISIVIFFVLSLKMIRPTIKYIKSIEQGVKKIATEDLTYKIAVIGSDELSSLAAEINSMGQQIYENVEKEKELDRNQRVLITNISHDLRTPLTSIKGYSELIEKNIPAGDPSFAYVEIVRKNIRRLEKLIGDLFLYAKITSNDLSYEMVRVDICFLLNQILETRKENYNITIGLDKAYVNLDPDKFHRIMENLLSNARKYGVEEETVDIDLSQNNGVVSVSIRNATEDELTDKKDFLMDRLYVANEERKEGSSGLGLSIVKELTEKMNGNVQINYSAGIFEVVLNFPAEDTAVQ